MIGNLSTLSKIEALLVKVGKSSLAFNTKLPVSVDVKEKLEPKTYLLQVGKKEMTTKSAVDLEVGKQYWGQMKQEPKSKAVSLSQLLQKPQLLKHQKSMIPSMNVKQLSELFSQEKPKEMMKMALLEKMTQATSKHEFLTQSNMLQALQENVFTFVMSHGHKETLFQLKKRPSKRKDEDKPEDAKLDFYAAFEHIGPVEGVVEVIDGIRKLSLYLYYENSLRFLQEELKSLDIEGFLYKKEGKISPLYEYGNSLLDLKG